MGSYLSVWVLTLFRVRARFISFPSSNLPVRAHREGLMHEANLKDDAFQISRIEEQFKQNLN
jgi:hypothetical protein